MKSPIAGGNRVFARSRLTRAVTLSLRRMQREDGAYVGTGFEVESRWRADDHNLMTNAGYDSNKL